MQLSFQVKQQTFHVYTKVLKNVLVTQRIVASGPETMKDVLQYVYSLVRDQKVIGEWLTLDLHQ